MVYDKDKDNHQNFVTWFELPSNNAIPVPNIVYNIVIIRLTWDDVNLSHYALSLISEYMRKTVIYKSKRCYKYKP